MAVVEPESSVPAEYASRIARELQPGERLIWAGRPVVWLYMLRSLPIFLFGIAFLVIAHAILSKAMHFGPSGGLDGDSMFDSVGTSFYIVGGCMLVSPAWYCLRAMRTLYAITDRRAILIFDLPLAPAAVSSYSPKGLGQLARRVSIGGAGDLVFEREERWSNGGSRTIHRGFLAVADVRRVESLLFSSVMAERPARSV